MGDTNMKKYGYFGEGLEGYMHYKLAFDRNFDDKEKDEFDSFDDCDTDCNDNDYSDSYENDD